MMNLENLNDSQRDSATGSKCGGVRIMPESWAFRVGGFLSVATDGTDGTVQVRPRVLFHRNYAVKQIDHFAGFNIRERHFRCIETFFIKADALGQIETVMVVEGIRTGNVVLNVNLFASRVLPFAPDQPSAALAEYMNDVIVVASEYCAASRLRFAYLLDMRSQRVVDGEVCQLLSETHGDAGLFVEARIPHETGRGRVAVMLGFPDDRNDVARYPT
jgi:hypothetical protein